MAKDKTPKPEAPAVEETPVTDPALETETSDETPTVEETPVTDPALETETSDETPAVEETPVDDPAVEENNLIESFENFEETHDDEVKPLSNREAARMLREKHQG